MMQRRGLGQFHDDAPGDRVIVLHILDEGVQPGRIARRGAGNIHRQHEIGMGMKGRHRHFQRMAIDKAHQPQLFGGGNELARTRDGAVGPGHAQQTFVMNGFAGPGLDNRLIGEHQPLVFQRGHHLIGNRHQPEPRGFELRRFRVDGKPVAAGTAGALQRLLRAQHRLLA